MPRKFTAKLIDCGTPVTLELDYSETHDCPTSWWDDEKPVIACWHRRYTLGHTDGMERLKKLVRSSRRYSEIWEEEWLWTPTDGRYENKHFLDLEDWPDLASAARKVGCIVLPVYLYDHSGLAVSLTPFSCPWDSGQVGFMVWSREQRETFHRETFRETEKRRQADIELMKSFFSDWQKYIEGEVYTVMVSDADDKEQIDCCGELYGEEYALGDALEEYFGIDPSSVQEIAA